MLGRVITDSHGCWSWKLRAEGLHIEPQTGNRENKSWQEAFKTQSNPAPVLSLLQ